MFKGVRDKSFNSLKKSYLFLQYGGSSFISGCILTQMSGRLRYNSCRRPPNHVQSRYALSLSELLVEVVEKSIFLNGLLKIKDFLTFFKYQGFPTDSLDS